MQATLTSVNFVFNSNLESSYFNLHLYKSHPFHKAQIRIYYLVDIILPVASYILKFFIYKRDLALL